MNETQGRKPLGKSEGRELLKWLQTHLSKQAFPGTRTPIPKARDCAKAIAAYLAGNVRSLDAAFGQETKRGRPVRLLRKARIAKKAAALRARGMSWRKIEQALAADGIHAEESVIRQHVAEMAPRFELRRAAREIVSDLVRNGHG